MDATKREEELELDPMFRPDSSAQNFAFQLYSWLQPVIFALAVLVVVSTFFGRLIGVEGDSMLPTLHNGDMLLLRSAAYTDPKAGDVVVLTPEAFGDGTPIVKRVIATAGQEVEVAYDADGTGSVYVDGEKFSDSFLGEEMRDAVTDQFRGQYPVRVPEGHIFVLGDNRNHSSDSRAYGIGMVDRRRVLGQAVWILMPFADFGGIAR